MSTPSDSPTHNQSGTVYPLSRLPPLQSSHLSSTDDYSSQPTDSGINTDHPPVAAESERAPASEPITQLPLLKNLQTSSRGLGWLTVIISIGLHGLLMLMPMPSAHQPAPPKPKKQIRVTQIPIPTLPKSSGVQAAPKPSSTPKKIPPAPKPVVRSQIVIPSVSKTPIRDTRSEPKPKAQPTPFEPQPKAQPTPSEPKPKAQPTPSEPQPKAQQDTQKQPATAATSAPLASTSDPWLDFPNYPEAKPGCFGLSACYQTSKELAQVGAHFEKELQAKQYDVKPDIQEANRKVYQVSKAGRTEFLSLVFAGGQEGTVYVRGPDRLSLGDFKTAVAVPPEVSNILNGLDPQKADPSYFAQPELFYTKQGTQGANANSDAPLPGISNISLISDQTADTLMDAFLRTNLRNNNFEVSDPPKHYAQGTLYEVKNGNNLTLYINLIPTKDQKGTLVVIWGSPPI